MLYLKATLLPIDDENEDYLDTPEHFVTEDDYEFLRENIGRLMGENDAYLVVQSDEMKYSDLPLGASIAEDMADIYQAVKDCIAAYRTENEDTMRVALTECREEFSSYWGSKLLNALAALHRIYYSLDDLDNDYDCECGHRHSHHRDDEEDNFYQKDNRHGSTMKKMPIVGYNHLPDMTSQINAENLAALEVIKFPGNSNRQYRKRSIHGSRKPHERDCGRYRYRDPTLFQKRYHAQRCPRANIDMGYMLLVQNMPNKQYPRHKTDSRVDRHSENRIVIERRFRGIASPVADNPAPLHRVATICDSIRHRRNELTKIYALLFGRKISKTQQLSNWEAPELTNAQQLYAATDAWACLHIYKALKGEPLPTEYRKIFQTPQLKGIEKRFIQK